jgi:hypothetical protein
MKIIVTICCVALFCVNISAQQISLDHVFQEKKYEAYLSNIAEAGKQTGVYITTSGIIPSTKVAIALEKTHGWDDVKWKSLIAQLSNTPTGQQQLLAIKYLLQGEAKGLETFFQAGNPDLNTWKSLISLFREHDFAVAADIASVPLMATSTAFNLPDPEKFQNGIAAWANIPAAQRTLMYPIILPMLQKNPQFTKAAFNAAMAGFLRRGASKYTVANPVGTQTYSASPKEYFDIALNIGRQTGLLNHSMVDEMIQYGMTDEAIVLIRELAAAQPADVGTQFNTFRELWNCNDFSGVLTCLQSAQKNVAEPQTREIRQQYIEYLKLIKIREYKVPGAVDITTFEQNIDLCMAGDSLLAQDKFPEAMAKYIEVFSNKNLPLARRLDAWYGWIDCDPDNALKVSDKVIKEIEKTDMPQRALFAGATSLQLCRVAGRTMPRPNKTILLTRGAEVGKAKRFHEPNNPASIKVIIAKLLDSLIDIAPEEILVNSASRNNLYLRLDIAEIMSLANMPDRAIAALKHPAVKIIQPPIGGWCDPLGKPLKDANEPRTYTYPAKGEIYYSSEKLLSMLNEHPDGAQNIPYLAGKFALEVSSQIKDTKNDFYVFQQGQILHKYLETAVIAVDKTQHQPKELNEIFDDFSKAYQETLTQKEVARSFQTVLRMDSILSQAHNPQTKARLCELVITAIEQYAAAEKDSKQAQADISKLLTQIDTRNDEGTKQMTGKLREKYIIKQ